MSLNLTDSRLADLGARAIHASFSRYRTRFKEITRRIFATAGVDSQIEFVNTDFDTPPTDTRTQIFRTYQGSASHVDLIQQILTDYPGMISYSKSSGTDSVPRKKRRAGK